MIYVLLEALVNNVLYELKLKGAGKNMESQLLSYIGNKKIIVFGTGKSGENLADALGIQHISYYIDNNKEKQGLYFRGKPVFSPDRLFEEVKDGFFVLIASMYYKEMGGQLMDMGLREKIDFDYDFMAGLIGNTFECSCCGGNYNEFLPFGIVPRPNAQCPSCYSLERHRLLWLYMNGIGDFSKTQLKVLHVAPENIIQKKLRAMKNVEYVSIDIDSPLADIIMDLTDLKFQDDYFDIILCNHVLEHIIEDNKAMSEIYRVLKPGGWSSLMVPLSKDLECTYEDSNVSSFEERLERFGQGDHVRVYGMDYFDRLKKAGFKTEIIEIEAIYDPKSIKGYSLNKEEDLIICRK